MGLYGLMLGLLIMGVILAAVVATIALIKIILKFGDSKTTTNEKKGMAIRTLIFISGLLAYGLLLFVASLLIN